MEKPKRNSLLGIIGGLMLAENLGDVHEEIELLCDLANVPRPEGDFMDGWTPQDWRNIANEEAAKEAQRAEGAK